MALDGIVVSNIVYELNEKLIDGRITKISQPEQDELLLTIKNKKEQYRLLISANASLPFIYLTKENKVSPMIAPNFCMLLRKHINGGRIVEISQPSLERIVHLKIEHLNELGDLCEKILTIELMGKHSNIIFRDKDLIIDSIKHVSAHTSSVREVLPGRNYFIAMTQEKLDPFSITEKEFIEKTCTIALPTSKAIYTSITGISPLIAEEICYKASIDSSIPANSLKQLEQIHLYHTFKFLIEDVASNNFSPHIIYKNEEPLDFSSLPLSLYDDMQAKEYQSITRLLEDYYATKNAFTRIRQRSADLRRIVQTALERNQKKYDLQLKQLKDTEKKEKYRVYGELINTYGYNLEENSKELLALNYYTNEMIAIPLDPDLSPKENSQKYFDRYNKLKRTYEALTGQIEETESEISHLNSISISLDIAMQEEDLLEIKEELTDFGYIKKKNHGKKQKITSKPFHYKSSDGYDMYVGKNNFQNDDLTFKLAASYDWWFHAKGIPGSHVIVKSNGDELPDSTFEEAAKLAAFYSKARANEKVEIDYTQKKHIKKAKGGKPGFVIYHTNYSMLIEPNIKNITLLS